MKKLLLSLAALVAVFGINKAVAASANPEYIGVAQGPSMMIFPTPAENDVRLMPSVSNPDIYEGTVTLTKTRTFAFYTESDGDYTFYTGSSVSTFMTISLSAGTEWPLPDPDNPDVESDSQVASHLVEGNNIKMYLYTLPKDYPTDVKSIDAFIRINWETKTFSISVEPYILTAPDQLYLWGTLGGFTDMARYTVMTTLTQTSEGSEIYEAEMVMPKCGPFEIDGEFTPLEGDPNYGFYFCLTNNGESISKGTPFQTPIATHLISVPDAGDVFTSKIVTDKTGCNMICLTPGKVKLTFRFETMELMVEMLEPLGEEEPDPTPDPETSTVTFSFTGVDEAYKYVSLYDINASEMIDLVAATFDFTYEESAQLTVGMTAENVENGYSFTISGDKETSDSTYIIGEGANMDGALQYVLMLYPGADGTTLTINVTYEDTEEPDENGIETIMGIDGKDTFNAVNLSGVSILRNGSKEDLRNLAPGFYIVNGRKLVVK